MFGAKEALHRAKLMMFINTVNQYIQWNIENRANPSVEGLKVWLKDKTGADLPIKDITIILGFMVNNFGLLILYGVNMQAEKIAEGMMQQDVGYWQWIKSKLGF